MLSLIVSARLRQDVNVELAILLIVEVLDVEVLLRVEEVLLRVEEVLLRVEEVLLLRVEEVLLLRVEEVLLLVVEAAGVQIEDIPLML
jgi:hypothetical protein